MQFRRILAAPRYNVIMDIQPQYYYLHPSALSVQPGANGSVNDLAVTMVAGARFRLYYPDIDSKDSLGYRDNTFQEWTMTASNKRFRDNDRYYIFARLSKTDKTGYIVFSKNDYILSAATTTAGGLPAAQTECDRTNYWWVKIGEVAAVVDDARAVTINTGVLGTTQWNNQWDEILSEIPTRIEVVQDGTGVTDAPWMMRGDTIDFTATVIHRWTTDISDTVHHWKVTRNTGNDTADTIWNNEIKHDLEYNTHIKAYVDSDHHLHLKLSYTSEVNDLGDATVDPVFTITAYSAATESDDNIIASVNQVVYKDAPPQREWIYFQSATNSYGTPPNMIATGEVNPSGIADGDDDEKNQDHWVPNGWTGKQYGVSDSNKYEFGSWRDSEKKSGAWGPFSTPIITNHFGQDGKPGENAIRIDLSNEHEDFIYKENLDPSDTLAGRVSGVVTSQATLYDGEDPATSGVTWSIDADHSVGVVTNDSNSPYYATIDTSTGLLTVRGISTQEAKVMVKAQYNNKFYYHAFTSQRTSSDKYELSLTPNSIAYNPDTYETQTINISASRTDMSGQTGAAPISLTANQGKLRIFVTLKEWVDDSDSDSSSSDSDSSDEPVLQTVTRRLTSTSFAVTAGTDGVADLNTGLRFELRKYGSDSTPDSSTTDYRVVDHETIPITKARDGENGDDGISYFIDTNIEHIDIPAGSTSATVDLSARIYKKVGAADKSLLYARVGVVKRAADGTRTLLDAPSVNYSRNHFDLTGLQVDEGTTVEIFVWKDAASIDTTTWGGYLIKKDIGTVSQGEDGVAYRALWELRINNTWTEYATLPAIYNGSVASKTGATALRVTLLKRSGSGAETGAAGWTTSLKVGSITLSAPSNTISFTTTDNAWLELNANTVKQLTATFSKSTQSQVFNISKVLDGQSITGATGRIPIPYGEYNNASTYVRTTDLVPYVYTTFQRSGVDTEPKRHYFLLTVDIWEPPHQGYDEHSDLSALAPSAWEEIPNFPYLFTEVLMAEMGTIGAWVFWGDYMFSGQGQGDVGRPVQAGGTFVPNLLFDAKTGKIASRTGFFGGFAKSEPVVVHDHNVLRMEKANVFWFETSLGWDASQQVYYPASGGANLDLKVPVLDLDAVGTCIVLYETPDRGQQLGYYTYDYDTNLPSGYGDILEPWREEYNGRHGYVTNADMFIHLPFVYPYEGHLQGTEDFLAAMEAFLGSYHAAEEEMLKAESYVGCTVEIFNLTHANFKVFGTYHPGSEQAAQRNPWNGQSCTIAPGTILRARCVRNLAAVDQEYHYTDVDYIYWEVISVINHRPYYTPETFNALGVYDTQPLSS